MNHSKVLFLLFSFILMSATVMEAQILDRVIRKTTRQVGNEVENMLVDKAAELIARKAVQSMETQFDKWIQEAIENDSTYYQGGNPDSAYYRAGQRYGQFINGLNDAVDLPDRYEFNLSTEVTMTDNETTQDMVIHYNTEKPVFAFTNVEKGVERTMLMDLERDAFVMYTVEKNGKKTAQALPNMMKLASTYADKNSDLFKPVKIKKTGKTKKVATYTCHEYKGESEDSRLVFYMAEDFPIKFSENFGKMMRQFAPSSYRDEFANVEGMVLASYTVNKKKPKGEYSSETKKVSKEKFEIINSEWTFGQ